MASSLPKSMLALKISGTKCAVTSVPLPPTPPDSLLAQVHSVALNPTDWKHIATKRAAENGTSGCDFAGTIVSLPDASTYTRRDLKVGDRITSVVHGANFSNPHDGAFAEYVCAKPDLVVKIPDGVNFESAATLPLGVSTVAQGLFQKGLKLSTGKLEGSGKGGDGEPVLIYGGSTATGSLGVQFAKLAGYRVLTVCGKRNEGFVKELGADEVFDYRDEGVGEKIKQATGGKLRLVWDCVGQEDSMKICAAALKDDDEGCRYATVNPATKELQGRPGVAFTATLMYTIFNEAFEKMGNHFPASQEDYDVAKKFFALTQRLLEEGKLKPHPEDVRTGGLEGVLQGLKDLQDGNVSGNKLVYRVSETPEGSKAEASF